MVAMSQFPDPEQPNPQPQAPPPYPQQPPPPQQPYPASAPTQFNPLVNAPAEQDQWQPQASGLPQAPPVPGGYGFGQYGGQAVPAGMYLDQQSGLLLPMEAELASPGRRIGAYFPAIPLIIVTLVIGYLIWGLIAWVAARPRPFRYSGCAATGRRPTASRASGGWRCAR
jgi:hypothetical protein